MVILFLSALTVGFSGAMMPGPLLTYTIRQSLSSGPRTGFVVATGHAFLELILVVLIFLGFGRVMQSDAAQIGIGVIGGALLTYMGIGMIVGAVKNTVKVQTDGSNTVGKGLFFSGIFISATNPYFLLWWSIVGLGFIMQSFSSFGPAGIAIYYFGHISADYLWYGFISVLVGTTNKFIKQSLYRMIIVVLGFLLVFFGVKFLYMAVMQLITILG